jgi:vacuolar-type H+-ATPase subunit H
MVDFNKLKSLGTELLGKANEFAQEAKEKAGPLAQQAKEKAGPLAEQAKEKAGPLADKAKEAAHKGFDKAAEGIDSATGGKYSDKIDTIQSKVDSALGSKATPVVTPEATFSDPADVVTETFPAEPTTVTQEPPVVTDVSDDLTETIADKLGDDTGTDKAEPASPTV